MEPLDSAREGLARNMDAMREYERITGFWQIARRALANNSFDVGSPGTELEFAL